MSNCKFKLHRRRTTGKKDKLPPHEECDCGNYHKARKVLVAVVHTKTLFIVLVARGWFQKCSRNLGQAAETATGPYFHTETGAVAVAGKCIRKR